jgi:hypothetical protein
VLRILVFSQMCFVSAFRGAYDAFPKFPLGVAIADENNVGETNSRFLRFLSAFCLRTCGHVLVDLFGIFSPTASIGLMVQ